MFKRASELVPDDPTEHYQLALELLRRRDASAAANHWRRALHSAGRLTESSAFRKNLSALIAAADRAREHETKAPWLHGEAVGSEQAGDYVAALNTYPEVLEVDPLNATVRCIHALVLCRLKRFDEGIEELEAILRDDPDDAETARECTIVWDQSRHLLKR